jgi:hypothetical protein
LHAIGKDLVLGRIQYRGRLNPTGTQRAQH